MDSEQLRLIYRTLRAVGKGVVKGLPPISDERNPIELFREWFQLANDGAIVLPEAVALATASIDAKPSVRMVLLKGVDDEGFRFFTNYRSRKADELETNPFGALVFHWAILERQVRVEGSITRLSAAESDEYFASRPRGSQIGAWSSDQSQVLENRDDLLEEVERVESKFEGREVPRPPHWGGYLLAPNQIEFWQGRVDRLHDRLRFRKTADGWATSRLYP